MMNLVEQFIDIYQVDWCFVLVNMGNSFSVFLFTCLLVSCWVNLLLPFSWFALGGRWPASSRQEQKVRAYREIERQNMNKALIDYLNFYLSPNGGSVPSSVSSPAYEQLLVFDQLFLRFSRSRKDNLSYMLAWKSFRYDLNSWYPPYSWISLKRDKALKFGKWSTMVLKSVEFLLNWTIGTFFWDFLIYSSINDFYIYWGKLKF